MPAGIAWEGVAPFAAPPGCPACACGPAEVTCAPPATWQARSEACLADAPYLTDFSPPPGWDGSCTTAGAIVAGVMCGGGPCVQSVEVGAPEVSLAPCAPVEITVPKDGTLSTAVRACEAPRETCAGGWCGGAGDCVFSRGEHECPSPWNERRVLFETAPDAGGCTPCECGPPAGGSCVMSWSVFADGSCTALLFTNVTLEPCGDVAAGSALGSKMAEVVSTTPGSCASMGGEPMGAQPSDPVTFCCR